MSDHSDDYRESEDEDFNPNAVPASDVESDNALSDDEGPAAAERVVRTRTQRVEKQPEYAEASASTVDVDALWAQFNDEPRPEAAGNAKSQPLEEEYVTIVRKFKFAGKVTTETKKVLKSSAEGREYLRGLKASQDEHIHAQSQSQRGQDVDLDSLVDAADAKLAGTSPTAVSEATESTSTSSSAATPTAQAQAQAQAQAKPAPRRGPVKRKSSLLEEYQAGQAKKLNTLQKSKLDWLGFVDKEGIQDDLKKHNKNGYLDKQGFLSSVEHKIEEGIRAHRG